MRTKNTTTLNLGQFQTLCQLIEIKADQWLRENGWAEGLDTTTVPLRYGFKTPKEIRPNKHVEHKKGSIKEAMVGYLHQKEYDLKKDFGLDDNKVVRFNGRELYRLAQIAKIKENIPVPTRYLKAYLAFIECDSIHNLPEPDSFVPLTPPKTKSAGQSTLPYVASAYNYRNIFDRALKNLHHTNWYLYEYDIQAKTGDPSAIVRSRFRITGELPDATGDIGVELLKNEPFVDFVGRLVYNRSNPRILIFRLETRKTKAKYLEIMLQVEQTLEKNLYMGIALRYDSRDSVVANTIVLEKRKESMEEMETVRFENTPENSELYGVSPALSQYFKHKLQNTLRVPSGISTPYDLQKWFERRRHVTPNIHFTVEFDLYIGSPISELNTDTGKEELERIKNEINEMRKDPTLEAMGIRNIYSPLCDEPWMFAKEPSKILEDELLKVRQSKAYLLIWDALSVVQSTVLVQLGWAMYASKPVFIVCRDRQKLPYLIQHATPSNLIFINSNHLAIKDIPKWLEINGYFRFLK